MKTVFNTPIFLGRGLFGWLNLELGILNLILAIRQPITYWSIFSGFVSGMCFYYFLYEGMMIRNSKLLDDMYKLNVDMLNTLKKIVKKEVQQKW